MGVTVKTCLGFALALTLLMAVGCAHPPAAQSPVTPEESPTPQGTQGWQEFRLPSSGIQLSIPEEWKVTRNEPRGTGHLILVEIPFPAAAETLHASQLVLSTTSNDVLIDVRAYGAWSLKDVVAKDPESIMAGALDGNSWMTVVSRAEQNGLSFAVIDRFGVSQGHMANLRVTLPLLARAPLSWFETTIPQVNAVIKKFSMGGENPSTSELAIEEGTLRLRSTDLNQPLNSPFSFPPRGILLGASPSAK
jgi:hypothetical protein